MNRTILVTVKMTPQERKRLKAHGVKHRTTISEIVRKGHCVMCGAKIWEIMK